MPLPLIAGGVKAAVASGLGAGISGLIGGLVGRLGKKLGYDPVSAAGGTQAAIQHGANQTSRELQGEQIRYMTAADREAATRQESVLMRQDDRAFRAESSLRQQDYLNQAALMVLQDRLETARLSRSLQEANARAGVPAPWQPSSVTGTNVADRMIRSIHSVVTGRDPGDIDWGSMMDRAYQDLTPSRETQEAAGRYFRARDAEY